MSDVNIILLPEQFGPGLVEQIKNIFLNTFYPFRLLLPITQSEQARFRCDLPNLEVVPVSDGTSAASQVDAALARCDAEFTVILPAGLKLDRCWLEDPLHALMNSTMPDEAIELAGANESCWGAVLRSRDLISARSRFGSLGIIESIKSAGISIRRPQRAELPFIFDDLLEQARSFTADGDYVRAAALYEHITQRCPNRLWMEFEAANCWFKAGRINRSSDLVTKINASRPTVDSLLLEGRLRCARQQWMEAINVLEKAQELLEGNIPVWK